MSALDWVFAASLALALALLSGWLDVPVVVVRAARKLRRPHLPAWVTHHGHLPMRAAHAIRHPSHAATRKHFATNPLPHQRRRSS